MTLDYTSHPAELVGSGKVKGKEKPVTIDDLKKAIPAHCFQPSYFWSFFYLLRDIASGLGFAYLAYKYIPLLPHPALKFAAWGFYGWVNGLVFTGIWVHGHECGHGGWSSSRVLNDVMGFTLHSALVTPYFAWKSTHRRHHIYANNLEKDHNYVPPGLQQYAAYLNIDPKRIEQMEELGEDAPVVIIVRIIMQQILGWPVYLFNNITASTGSLYRPQSKAFLGNSHLLPSSTLFRPEEAHLILISDIGLVAMLGILYYAGTQFGFANVALFYGQPYLWLNHWIVAITYLHHTHPNLPKYMPEAWSFIKGALATVDRNYGFVGKHMLHNIADYHVIHHLFSRIPQYHAEEATKAIMPLLGDAYHSDSRGVIETLWESFTKCQWVKPDDNPDPKERALWYQSGVCPPPAKQMWYHGWM